MSLCRCEWTGIAFSFICRMQHFRLGHSIRLGEIFLKFVINLKWLAEYYSKTDLIIVPTKFSYSLFIIFSHLYQSKLLKVWHCIRICFLWRSRPLVGQRLHFFEAWRSRSDAAHALELFWASDQLYTEKYIWHHTTLTTDRHACCRRDSNQQ
jgi:hypothetical protein